MQQGGNRRLQGTIKASRTTLQPCLEFPDNLLCFLSPPEPSIAASNRLMGFKLRDTLVPSSLIKPTLGNQIEVR